MQVKYINLLMKMYAPIKARFYLPVILLYQEKCAEEEIAKIITLFNVLWFLWIDSKIHDHKKIK